MPQLKIVLITIILGISPSLCMAAHWVGLGVGVRYENDSDSSKERARTTLNVLGGIKKDKSEYVAEFSYFNQETGNETLKISRDNYLVLGNYRYYPFNNDEVIWYPYFSGGLGLVFESVKTVFLNSTNKSSSVPYLVTSLGVGTWPLLSSNFRLGCEVRVLVSKTFSPNGLLDLGLRAAYEF